MFDMAENNAKKNFTEVSLTIRGKFDHHRTKLEEKK